MGEGEVSPGKKFSSTPQAVSLFTKLDRALLCYLCPQNLPLHGGTFDQFELVNLSFSTLPMAALSLSVCPSLPPQNCLAGNIGRPWETLLPSVPLSF